MKVQNQILVNLEKSELDEATKWKHIAGPRYKFMDEKYEMNIMTKLIPMLYKYGIDIAQRPIQDKPGKQSYVGYDKDYNKIRFNFYNQHEDKLDNREGKYDMLVTIDYKENSVEAGVVDLRNKDYAEKAFEIITMTLEDLGFNLDGSKETPKEEQPKSEDDIELDNLASFKKSLSEQEILEIEVDD